MKGLKLLSYLEKGKSNLNIGWIIPDSKLILPLKLSESLNSRGDYYGRLGGIHDVIDNNTKEMKNIINQIKKFDFSKQSDLLIPLSKLNQIPLIPRRNIICVGKNYIDHVKEIAKVNIGSTSELPSHPIFFTKAPDTIVGPNKGVQSHSEITKWLDYEAELAVIIGKSGKNIKIEDASKHIFGYSIANDITARDIQKRHSQWFKGKTLDTTCPMSATVLIHDDTIDHQNLDIKLWLNKELKQSSNTSNMIFNVATIISELSKGFTLNAGDIILTGTPDGVGFSQQIALKSGDTMKIEIEKIGTLTNHIK